MKRYAYLFYILVAILCFGCNHKRVGTVEGIITNANGELLVLEHLGKGRPEVVDTLLLDEHGHFKFTPEVENGPDFFCLRLVTQVIPFVIDTLQTPVTVTADLKKFGTDYTIQGSNENNRIKEASLLSNMLRKNMMDVNTLYNEKKISQEVYRDTVQALLAHYKQKVLEDYIYVNPSSPASYYILFQSIVGMSIFDPFDAEDNRAFGAIATGWKYNYPNSPRSVMLEKLAIEGQRVKRLERQKSASLDSLMKKKVDYVKYYEIMLSNQHDEMVPLSSLIDHQHIILLDFTAYGLQTSVAHNMKIAELYDKYQQQGLRVYQVCIDMDENFWKVSANNVPWTVVRDKDAYFENGNLYSRPASVYNVTKLPMMYLLDRDGAIMSRVEEDAELESAIKKLL